MPSITTWTRVEPNPRNPKMESSLRAAVSDPLWMLARQWQLGEFEGDDAGSPAVARFQAECAPLSQYEPQTGAGAQPTTFTKFGITDFDVQYWDGTRWTTVPGGSVTGNNKVWVKLKFPAVYTDRVRVVVNKALAVHSRIVEVEAYQSTPQPSDRDILWVDEDIPAGATAHVSNDQWNWITSNPAPVGGTRAHQSNVFAGQHQHFFENATTALPVNYGDTLFAYVFLDPANLPGQIMLQWNDGTWEHRAYWGDNKIEWGVDGTMSRRYMGVLPPAGQWVRLEVPASLVGLEGRTLRGMAFTLFGGRATWDRAGKSQKFPPGVGLFAEYFDNIDLTNLKTTRIDPSVNFEWGTNAPDAAIAADTFSARWSGQVVPLYTEQYTFYTVADDGVRLWVDGQLLINDWNDHGPTESRETILLTAGQKYDIRMEYYENGGAATAKLLWSSARQAKQVIPQSQLYPPATFTVPPVNVALAAAGSVASASSTHSAGFPAQGAINGDRKGTGWEKGGGWNDATPDAYPDWLQVNFNGLKLIEEIGVVTLQDDLVNAVDPVPYTQGSAQTYNALSTPLETLVERERVRGTDNLRHAAEAGLHFLRLLAAHGAGQYRRAYVNQYALSTPHDPVRADDDSTRFAGIVSRRIPDGQRLYTDLREALRPARGGRGALPASPPIAGDADRQKITAAAEAWLKWYESLFSEQAAGVSPWVPERMEYEFTVASKHSTGRIDLVAPEYAGGTLDWHDFDARLDASDKLSAAPELLTREVVPTPVSYRGMPASRYWEFEDAQVNWGDVSAGDTDLARLMLIEFALVFGNDWFVIPVDLPVGSITRPRSFVVTDTFGIRTNIAHYSEVDAADSDWRMFNLAPGRGGATADVPSTLFFLAPTTVSPLESASVEEVLFLRDEMANVAWAVERAVENLLGRPLNRYESFQKARQAGGQALSRMNAQEVAELAYKLGSEVPDYWIPLLPAQVSPRSYKLRRGAMPTMPDSRDSAKPAGQILEPRRPLALNEEEVSRAGIRVTRAYQYARWADGSTHLWVGRRKQPGRGEGSSGLRFDTIEPTQR